MAEKLETLLVDDLDGSTADETVRFAFEGRSYEIDLSAANAERLRSSLQPFVAAARKAGPPRRRGGGRRTATSRARSAQIRAWAKAQGLKLSERGRIPATVVEQYEAEH
jgi:nucleoid-associated protein Lsr2